MPVPVPVADGGDVDGVESGLVADVLVTDVPEPEGDVDELEFALLTPNPTLPLSESNAV